MSTAIVVMGANGRMGRTISDLIAADTAFTLAGLVDHKDCLAALSSAVCPVADSLACILPQAPGAVVIDFTAPEVSLASARLAAACGQALVIGTTGFTEDQKDELRTLARKAPIFWSSNMSIGVNVLVKILPLLTRALGESYDIEMVELHHNRKKDSPSGTALTLGECLAEARGWQLPDVRCSARDGIIGERPKAQIGIQAVRGGDVVGVHTVYFMGPGERIEVSHQAHSRETFAQGALRAAAWLAGQKPGRLYGMQDMF
ncbi:MAG: 4-hydroxy-tetrahydrodipicolinate reductase [Desulfovibrio sp.]|nr:4-hydroxy-tetrahydrodipicolinate reductase [Desulfovibrio sp.]